MFFDADINLLLVKLIPSVVHEAAHIHLSQEFVAKTRDMGVPIYELYALGSERIGGRNSSKEADAAYKPVPVRSLGTDWPTIVFESGVSESLNRLRAD